jgi:methylmalonyl-CoA mutase
MNQKDLRPALFADFKPTTAAEWEEKIRKDIKGENPADLVTNTYENIAIKPFYSPEDIANVPYLDALPGKFPYVRGHKTTNNNWQNIQDVIATNDARLAIDKGVKALAAGADGLHFKIEDEEAFDLPYLINQIDLTQTPVSYSVSKQPEIFIQNLYNLLKEKGISAHGLKGFIALQPLHATELGVTSVSKLETLIEITKNTTDFYGVAVNGAQFGNRGATAVQEIAFTLSQAISHLIQLSASGIPVPTIFRNMQFLLSTGTNYFLEIAKLRAVRLLWSGIVKVAEEDVVNAAFLRLHSTTSRWFATTFEPHTNILRTTTEAMSAILGGCDSVSVAPFDITIKQDNAFSERIARNISLILKHEANLHQVIDPAAGSYYLESLTQQLAQNAWFLFQEIEAKGGFEKALSSGYILEQLIQTAQAKFKNISSGQDILVGTNKFTNNKEQIDYDAEALLQSNYFDTTRAAYPFEVMRLAALLHFQKKNQRPKAIIAIIGHDIQEHIHAAFAKEFFDCGDFVTEILHFETVKVALEKLLFIDCKVLVFSSTESDYALFAQHYLEALKKHKYRPLLILAAPPEDMKEELEENGFDARIFRNCNARSIIGRIQERLLTSEV